MQTDAIWQILPQSIKEALKKGGISLDSFEEIRIRTQRPVSVRRKMNLFYLNQNGSLTKTLSPEMSLVISSKAEMEQILLNASHFSVYAAEEQIRQGYLTIQGGHRIGICGEVILSDGKLQGIRKISSYNIRMAREVRGCAREIYPWLWEKERFLDTLIVSPPGLGKTTLLRDLVRLISVHMPLPSFKDARHFCVRSRSDAMPYNRDILTPRCVSVKCFSGNKYQTYQNLILSAAMRQPMADQSKFCGITPPHTVLQY